MNAIPQRTMGPSLLQLVLMIVVLAALVAAAWFLADTFWRNSLESPAVSAPASIAARPVGMGDVRRYEGELALQNRPVGMGDVRLFESTQRSK